MDPLQFGSDFFLHNENNEPYSVKIVEVRLLHNQYNK